MRLSAAVCLNSATSRSSVPETREIVEHISTQILELGGFPNFFGIQRFGAVRPLTHLVGKAIVERDFQLAVEYYVGYPQEFEPDSLKEARTYFMRTKDYEGPFEIMNKYYTFERTLLYYLINKPGDYIGALKQLPKNLLMMFTHAYQSYLFNRIVSERIRQGIPLNEPVVGDMVIPTGGNGIPDHVRAFRVNEANLAKITTRTKEFKSYVTALLYGHDSDFAEGQMGEIERAIVEKEGISPEAFMIPDIPVCSSTGMRKELLSHVDIFEREIGSDWVRFMFKLYKGSYATTLLREFIKSPIPSAY
jgi:tRNA pseudouridine13 synthase